jgi:hypothetical protein
MMHRNFLTPASIPGHEDGEEPVQAVEGKDSVQGRSFEGAQGASGVGEIVPQR